MSTPYQQQLAEIIKQSDAQHQALFALAEQLGNLHNQLSKPKRIIRGEDGKIIGSETIKD